MHSISQLQPPCPTGKEAEVDDFDRIRHFAMDCPPEDDLRVDSVVFFLRTMRGAFCVSDWRDHDKEIVQLSRSFIREHFLDKWRMEPPASGGLVTIGPIEGSFPLRISISTGSDEYVWDFMSVEFRDSDPVPELLYFRQCIEQCRPTVAEILHLQNKRDMHTAERAKAFKQKKYERRPVVVHWLHYWNHRMAQSFGGVKRCLETPAYRTEEFAGGILIQLTKEPLDPNNSVHLLAQRKAMEHLGMPWEFTPPPRSNSSFFPT